LRERGKKEEGEGIPRISKLLGSTAKEFEKREEKKKRAVRIWFGGGKKKKKKRERTT